MNYAHTVTATKRGVTSVSPEGVPTIGTVTVLDAVPCAFATASAGEVIDRLGSGVPVETATQHAWLYVPGWLDPLPESGASLSDYRFTVGTFDPGIEWKTEACARGTEATRYLLSVATA